MENRAIEAKEDTYNTLYARPGDQSGALPLLTTFIQITRWTPRVNPIHTKNGVWAIDYHFENAGEFSLDGDTWSERKKGTLHLYAPDTHFWERSLHRHLPFSETYALFRASEEIDLLRLVQDNAGVARIRDPDAEIGRLFSLLAHASAENAHWRVQSALYRILDVLSNARRIDGCDYDVRAGQRIEHTLVEQVNAFVRGHYHESVTLGEIADVVGVSRSTLTHRYRQDAGTTPMAYLSEYRLDIAYAMISRGMPLKSVASRTGFYDEYHLSNCFKKRFGAAPARYFDRG